jgi:hypothetical protein
VSEEGGEMKDDHDIEIEYLRWLITQQPKSNRDDGGRGPIYDADGNTSYLQREYNESEFFDN